MSLLHRFFRYVVKERAPQALEKGGSSFIGSKLESPSGTNPAAAFLWMGVCLRVFMAGRDGGVVAFVCYSCRGGRTGKGLARARWMRYDGAHEEDQGYHDVADAA